MDENEFFTKLTQELLSSQDYSRNDVFLTFSQFVSNKQMLHYMVNVGLFTYEYVHFKTKMEGTLFEEGIYYLTELCRKAYEKSSEEFLKIIDEYASKISQGYATQTQNVLLNSDNIDIIRLDLFSRKMFSIIGEMIEGCLKPYLQMFYSLEQLVRGNNRKKISLGGTVNELIKLDEIYDALLKRMFLDIPISQWRNISAHNSFFVCNGIIKAEYGDKYPKNEILLKKDRLIEILVTLDTVLYMNKIVYTLLPIDYPYIFNKIKQLPEKNEETLQDDIKSQIVESSFAYGFLVKEFDFSNKILNLQYKDMRISEKELIDYLVVVFKLCGNKTVITIYDNNKKEIEARMREGQIIIFS